MNHHYYINKRCVQDIYSVAIIFHWFMVICRRRPLKFSCFQWYRFCWCPFASCNLLMQTFSLSTNSSDFHVPNQLTWKRFRFSRAQMNPHKWMCSFHIFIQSFLALFSLSTESKNDWLSRLLIVVIQSSLPLDMLSFHMRRICRTRCISCAIEFIHLDDFFQLLVLNNNPLRVRLGRPVMRTGFVFFISDFITYWI